LLDPALSEDKVAIAWAGVAADFTLAESLKDTLIQPEDWMTLTTRLCDLIDRQNRNAHVPALNAYCTE
jgi:hypothetical protein